ncbi:MAG TPA: response regulator [Puia sp.]|jgi:two-component system OmpR family response regulator|nr:response regulator [Puia sp.]
MVDANNKVLIVDDELDICYLLSGMLKQRNLMTGFVNTLSDAVIALQTDTPSILFLDNHLPDGFGLDFIPYIKKNYPEVKVIMITAHDGAIERKQAYEGGVDLFVAKPLNRKLINDAIDKLYSSDPTGRIVYSNSN